MQVALAGGRVSEGGPAGRIAGLMPRARRDLAELVAFRSVAPPSGSEPEECDRAAAWLLGAFAGVGLGDVAAHETADGSKAVFGHRPAPPGAPTVLLYCHYDVVPPLAENDWETPPFELTERSDGRWYGRGAADCKGNVVAHLTALRALGDELPVGVKMIAEGSEEQGTGGLEALIGEDPALLAADAMIVCDTGNFEPGLPTLTTTLRGAANLIVGVRTLRGPLHSGVFGGAAPDALAALIQMLAGLRDADGDTTIDGLPESPRWEGIDYPPARFRQDAGLLDGVGITGTGTVAEMLWARPALTVLGIDAPTVAGSTMSVPAEARARISLRLPPGIGGEEAIGALRAQLERAAPWGAEAGIEVEEWSDPFVGSTSGQSFEALAAALEDAYGRAHVTQGQGGSIPLCNRLQETYPEAAVMLIGVEEPGCLIHAPNESVDPSELERIALAEALFLSRCGAFDQADFRSC
ncbi:MAG TPA: dipeptidase [Solirubrobacterales bacterium]|jgi:acetylornithine deacetylase/succinyl-diaminopimelate desuccinylase-like protein|nr:dipeptidase [Solirubrobacterales bacterium]